jgi:hypothetical protein
MHPANNGDYGSFVRDGLGLGLGQCSTHWQTSIERVKQERLFVIQKLKHRVADEVFERTSSPSFKGGIEDQCRIIN